MNVIFNFEIDESVRYFAERYLIEKHYQFGF